MSWLSELSKLYDLEADIVGEDIDGKTLLPVYHSTQKAQIDVFLFDDASFAYGKAVDESDSVTIIPVSIKAKTSGIAPHPLCEGLKYVAGDYSKHVKNAKKDYYEYFRQYIKNLKNWVESAFTDRLLAVIYSYLKKENLMADLIESGLLTTTDNGELEKSKKIAKIPQADCFVRFTIIDKCTGETESVWRCKRLYEQYIQYADSIATERDICYVTGNLVPVTYNHSKGISSSSDTAKLLSANDKNNFTFRGRICTQQEAYAVGRKTSQKAHLALRWLIERQGTTVDTAIFVVWESEQQSVIDAAHPFDLWELFEDDELMPKTNREYGRAVAEYIKGYRQKLDFSSKIMLMCLNKSSKGRLSVVQYQEFTATEYYDHLEKWYCDASWHTSWSHDGKHYHGIATPSPYQIALFAIGVERSVKKKIALSANRVEHSDTKKIMVDKKQMNQIFREIHSCILHGTTVPIHILKMLYNRCANPLRYDAAHGNWEKLLDITCALYRKHYIEKNGVTFNVGLDRTCTDRSYLFGRLTAVADKMETDTFEKDIRQTNAKRYMSAMLNAPFKTWAYLEERVLPYTAKIIKQNPQYYARYEKELEEIHSLFQMEDYSSNERLNAKFFMGFYCQKQDFYKKAIAETEE